MRDLRYIPFSELRRMYRREREIKDCVRSTALLLAVTLLMSWIYLLG